jgi:hypothetical protein
VHYLVLKLPVVGRYAILERPRLPTTAAAGVRCDDGWAHAVKTFGANAFIVDTVIVDGEGDFFNPSITRLTCVFCSFPLVSEIFSIPAVFPRPAQFAVVFTLAVADIPRMSSS